MPTLDLLQSAEILARVFQAIYLENLQREEQQQIQNTWFRILESVSNMHINLFLTYWV
jgi:hypothetical protein